MANFTKGPWKEVPQNSAGPMIAHEFETGNQMNPTGLRLVCHVLQRGNSITEDRANAHLIAAAPELLEQLQALVGLLDESDEHEIEDSTLDECRAVIAKAEGK